MAFDETSVQVAQGISEIDRASAARSSYANFPTASWAKRDVELASSVRQLMTDASAIMKQTEQAVAEMTTAAQRLGALLGGTELPNSAKKAGLNLPVNSAGSLVVHDTQVVDALKKLHDNIETNLKALGKDLGEQFRGERTTEHATSTSGSAEPGTDKTGGRTPEESNKWMSISDARRQGKSLSGVSKHLQEKFPGLATSRVGGSVLGTLSEGGTITDAAQAGVGSIIGAGAMADAIPIVGEAVMGATALYTAANFIGGQIAKQRAQNASFQSIIGGNQSMLGSGAITRGEQALFAMGQTGMLTNDQANGLFLNVTQTGLQGNARQNALDFAVSNYSNMGMSLEDSQKLIGISAKDTAQNLTTVAAALQAVSNTAVATGVNANLARSGFIDLYTTLANAGGGAGAALAAQTGQNFFTSMGRVGQGGTFNWGSVGSDSMIAAQLGTSLGGAEAAMANGANGAALRAGAQADIFNKFIVSPNAQVAALARSAQFAPTNGQNTFQHITAGSGLGAAILNATPGGFNQIASQLEAAGVDTSRMTHDGILNTYANILRNPNGIYTQAQRDALFNKQESFRKSMGTLDQFAQKHGNTWLGQTGYGLHKDHTAWGQSAQQMQDSALVQAAYHFQKKTGQEAHFKYGGQEYSLQEAMKDPKIRKALYDEGMKSKHGWDFEFAKPTDKVIHQKGQANGAGAGGGKGVVQIQMAPNLQGMLQAVILQNNGNVTLNPPNQSGVNYGR